jgi:RNA polymerase sigma-70 factor (ECF subfamily)
MTAQAEFLRLFMPIQGDLLAFLLSIGVASQDADDLLQEAAADMIDKFERFTPRTQFRAWAYAFVRNEALRYFKTRARRPFTLTPEAMADIEQLATAEPEPPGTTSRALALCLERLHLAARSLLVMRYRDGRSVKEIAEAVRRPVDSVYTSLSRIRKALQGCIERSRHQVETSP